MPRGKKELTPEEIEQIRNAEGSDREIARQFDTYHPTVKRIKEEQIKKSTKPNPTPTNTYTPKRRGIYISEKYHYVLEMLVETGLKAYKSKNNSASMRLKRYGKELLEIIKNH